MKDIFEGLKNYGNDTDIPKERLEQVRNCPNRVKAKIKALSVSDRYEETDGYICKKCYCPLATKLRVKNCDCDGVKKN